MNKDLVVSESIDIQASISQVWEALTNPSIIKEYLFGTNTITDWKVGSEVSFQGEFDGHSYQDKGIVLENDLHKTLSYSYWSGFSGLEDMPENYAIVKYTIESISPEMTAFTWTQTGYPSPEAHQHSQSGMKEFLEHMKSVIEGRNSGDK